MLNLCVKLYVGLKNTIKDLCLREFITLLEDHGLHHETTKNNARHKIVKCEGVLNNYSVGAPEREKSAKAR